MSKTWFTSDSHFGHTNIIKLCNRPFKDIVEMDQTLVENWNKSVKPEDTVYCLGDFAYKNAKALNFYADALNGTKHLVLGNHDHKSVDEYKKYFATVQDVLYVEIEKQLIVMFHYPIFSWKKKARGAWHLYGHVHNAVLDVLKDTKSMNMCVDVTEFKPVEFDAIKEIMDQSEKTTKYI